MTAVVVRRGRSRSEQLLLDNTRQCEPHHREGPKGETLPAAQ